MSEQPASNVIQFPGSRDGNRFEGNEVQFDLHKNITVPEYDTNDIARVHQIEAARQAREAVIAAERLARMSEFDPRPALQETGNVVAIRRAAINGEIKVA